MIEYAPGLVAFVAALLAVMGGDKIDKSKRGLHKITRLGWCAIALALIALGAGIAITKRSQDALSEQQRQREIIRSVADTELRLAIRTITQWFFFLVDDDNEATRFALAPPHILDAQKVQNAEEIDIRTSPSFVSPATSWAALLKTSADRGSQEITQTLQIYAPYIDPEALALLSELRTSEFLNLRLRTIDDYVETNKNVKTLHFDFIDPPGMLDHRDTGYAKFWQIVIRLDQILKRDDAKLERRLSP
jgi:hypothetical protein